MLIPASKAYYQTLKKGDLIEIILEQNRVIEAGKQDQLKVAAQFTEMKRILGLRNKKIFGSSSEKSIVVIKEQQVEDIAFEELNKPLNQPQATADADREVKEKKTYHAVHPGRYAIPEHIRREEHHIYPTGYEPSWKRELDPERTERLSLKIELVAEVTIRHKYVHDGQIRMAAFAADDPFYKYKATVELVATQMMLRFALHMPYYRFRQLIFGCPLSYPTLISWAARAFELMAPLREVLHAEIISNARLLGMDETTFKLMDTPLKIAAFKNSLSQSGLAALDMLPANQYVAQLKKETISIGEQQGLEREMENGLVKGKIVLKGQMWALVNSISQLVLFDYSPSRATVNAVLMLKDYQGLLMADAYSGYIRLAKLMGINITLLSCWAHCRRRFLESQNPGNPDQVIKEIIHRIAQLYQIEKQVKGCSPREKKKVRKRSRTILGHLKIYLEEKIQHYALKESVAVSIQYCLNHWNALTQYTRYGIGIIDNNITERAIRPLTGAAQPFVRRF